MKIIPYLYFNGNAEEAINYYRSVFGGEITVLQRYSDGPEGMPVPENYDDKIMHARLEFGDATIYFSDFTMDMGDAPHSLSVEFDDIPALDAAYRTLSGEGQVIFELGDTFWGARYAKVADRYGLKWDLNYQYPQEGGS